MNIELWSLLILAFGLGMIHALDADHIIAVSGLSCQSESRNHSLMFCLRWALGHGAALFLIGAAVILLGMAIPETLSQLAEQLVGAVLILIGLYVIWDVYKKDLHLHFHQHDGMSDHAHWHEHAQPDRARLSQQVDEHQHESSRHQHSHAPVFVGVLHGTAGSAPLLALLPLSQISSPWAGMAYLFLFGLGVFISMLVFGGIIGQIFVWMKNWGNRFITSLRITVSIISIGYGAKLIITSI